MCVFLCFNLCFVHFFDSLSKFLKFCLPGHFPCCLLSYFLPAFSTNTCNFQKDEAWCRLSSRYKCPCRLKSFLLLFLYLFQAEQTQESYQPSDLRFLSKTSTAPFCLRNTHLREILVLFWMRLLSTVLGRS